MSIIIGDRFLAKNDTIIEFRVNLKQENPPTDIRNSRGRLIFHLKDKNLIFLPEDENQNDNRQYNMKDYKNASIVTSKEWFRKKELIMIKFSKKQVTVEVYFEPIDVSADYLLQQFLEYRKQIANEIDLASTVGSFIEKLGIGSQKIVKEIGTLIQSSHELTQAISQSIAFIREAIQTTNILDSVDMTEDGNKHINLKIDDLNFEKNIDEILKRSIASEKIEAMISGLIAKGLISARDKKFQEALDTLKIAREAAEKENLTDYANAVDENMENIKKMDSSDDLDTELSEKAIKYATDARDIVSQWEALKNNENGNKNNK